MKAAMIALMTVALTVSNASGAPSMKKKLPENFVFLSDVDPTVIESVRYYTADNFLGRPVKGYTVNKIISTKEAAEQLKKAHKFFKSHGYTLVVYDGYRPQRAVDEFREWGSNLNDIITKKYYYPTLEKKEVFEGGYIAPKTSTHSRGSTFDLTLMDIENDLQALNFSERKLQNGDTILFLDDGTVDMGSSFDLFHPASHHDSSFVSPEKTKMRNFLREGMKKFGFKDYQEEWWHYTLDKEPFPETYFDFVVE